MNSVSRPDALHALAADVGGTTMRAAIVTAEAEVVTSESRPTEPDRDIEDAAMRLAGIIGIVHERGRFAARRRTRRGYRGPDRS